MFRVVHFQRITEDILIQRLWVIYLQIIIILTRAQSKLNYGQPTRRRSMWWWSVEMGPGTEWSDRKSKSRVKDTADDTFLDPCPR